MDSTTTTPTQPLADRSTNTHLQPNPEKLHDLKSAPANMTSLEYHRQVLHGKLENGEKYVSSDTLFISLSIYLSMCITEKGRVRVINWLDVANECVFGRL